MGNLNLQADEAALLKAYRISSLDPRSWEDVDHETSDSLVGALPDAPEFEADPLGLGATIE
ncbi:hypothetical protein FRC08_015519 [Ceratobasidium sp. 394]|nr:hypothetical protein FRC08_015519 [Ceratobasidium sp. 394]